MTCRFEARTGRPCILCRAPQPGEHAALPPDSDAHDARAEACDRLAARELYAERGFVLEGLEIEALPDADRLALDAWAATDAPLPAAFAVRAHVAAPVTRVGDRISQPCTRCGCPLQEDAADEADGAYPVGAHVGLDCDGRKEGPCVDSHHHDDRRLRRYPSPRHL